MKLERKKTGYVVLVIGAFFFIAGIVLFIMSNYVNVYSQKVEATIVSKSEVETDDGESHYLLGLVYSIGNEIVETAESFYDELEEDQVNLTIYYDVRNPQRLVEGGWHFEALIVAFIGIVIVIPGLILTDIVTFGIAERKAPSNKASKWTKDFYEAREKTENDIMLLAAAAAVLGFGIYLILVISKWWSWIFIGLGGMGIIYILIDFIPALRKFLAMRKVSKVKVVSTDDDFEKFEKKKALEKKNAKSKTNSSEESFEDFEVEETFEIKDIKGKKNKKKK